MDCVVVLKAIANEIRLKIIALLYQEPLSASDLAKKVNKMGKTLSRQDIFSHLNVLVDGGILGKKYDIVKKSIVYFPSFEEIRINLKLGTINTDAESSNND